MSIDFHDPRNRSTYSGRHATEDWSQAMLEILAPQGVRVADIGCGGGIYSRAWAEAGAAQVIGVDFSQAMVTTAAQHSADDPRLSFQQGSAHATGLATEHFDVVFERALIHHLEDLEGCFAEAFRVLAAGGRVIIQDRTADDIQVPGSAEHLRGYFFDCFPRLIDYELKRRPSAAQVEQGLLKAGFTDTATRNLWETRRTYTHFDELANDLRQRTGRSILHELDDGELEHLIAYIGQRIDHTGPIIEQDRWTLWTGRKR